MAPMVKSEFVGRLAARFPDLTRADANAAVGHILRAMTTTLAQGDRVEIRDFGSFSVTTKPPKTGRNPATGEAVAVPAKSAPHFKPGRLLREVVDRD
jgi:integration host factor subunit beta